MIKSKRVHSFYIPVMGTAFTIDSPVKIARFGIHSVVSIVDHELCEVMREYYSKEYDQSYTKIDTDDEDHIAKRITGYLNLLNWIVNQQMEILRAEPFEEGNDIVKYFMLLSEASPLKEKYLKMCDCEGEEKKKLQDDLRAAIVPGEIEVNIMTKIDKDSYDKQGNVLPPQFSYACSALKGFAESDLTSSIVFSAGFNRRLYSSLSSFDDFYPDEDGQIKKKIILKVSDYRSSETQGKFLAKKGIWISEYRIESGLNCGGHAFATDGFLMGPILEEFKQKRVDLMARLFDVATTSLLKLGRPLLPKDSYSRVTVQGGIGSGIEKNVLIDYFGVDATGWASPFLLVPEVTRVDDETRLKLRNAERKDFYLSDVSPLGVPFNTVRNTPSELQKLERARSGRPGSPCPKGFLVSDTTYSKRPVCKASRFYQKRALESVNAESLSEEEVKKESDKVIEKVCLCEDLAAAALTTTDMDNKRPLKTAICPGPNLAYFSKYYTMSEMISHIYGRTSLIDQTQRPNMFMHELTLYLDFLSKELKQYTLRLSIRKPKYFEEFKNNLLDGIEYYKTFIPKLKQGSAQYRDSIALELDAHITQFNELQKRYKFIFDSSAEPMKAKV